MTSGLDRRHILGGAIGLPVLAACGSDDPDSATDPASSPTGSSSSTDAGSEAPGDAGAGAGALAATSEIPVGGCAVFAEQKCVVTQPSEGDFKAFTSVCTHQGCTVSAATDGVIPCSCHGSQFSIEDGSVLQGPATAPLAAVAITVDGDSILLA